MTAGHAGRHSAEPAFDGVRATVHGGDHVVGRYPGALILIRRDSTTGSDRIPELLDICLTATSAAPRAPGRQLARRLTGWLSQAEDAPGFGTVAATEDGLAIFLYGEVTVEVPAEDLRLSGRTAAFSVDRLIDWPEGVLSLRADSSAPGSADLPEWFRFHLGVVTGSGATLHIDDASEVASAAGAPTAPPTDQAKARPPAGPPLAEPPTGLQRAEPEPDEEPETAIGGLAAAPPPPDPEVQGLEPAATPPPPAVFDQIHGVAPDEPQRPPLAVAFTAAPAATDRPGAPPTGFLPTPVPQEEGTVVLGFRCSREHLNDPRVSFCATCGIRMDQRTGVLVRGRRPPLGLIVLDTGSTFVLDDDYLLGRDPDHDGDVLAGRLRPLRLDDNSGTLSRAHVEIRLQEWDVTLVDRGSANGTYVAAPQQQAWVAVVPHQAFALTAGSQVGLGRRTFTFESPHGRL